MRKTAKVIIGIVLTTGGLFAGAAAASAGGVPPTFHNQVGETEYAGDPCGDDAPYGLVVPDYLR